MAIILRSFLFFTLLIIYTPIYALFCLICFPFLKMESRYWLARKWCVATTYFANKICGVRYQVQGIENLPKKGQVIVLSKHQSNWETLALPTILPKPICYAFKKELNRIPFFSWVLYRLNMIQVDRAQGKNSFASMATQGQRRLQEGAWILMFPEGTRTAVGAQNPTYKTGGVRLAIHCDVPYIVPIALNSGSYWPRKRFLLKPGYITVSIGAPIPVAGKAMKDLHFEMQTWIENEMHRIEPNAYNDTTHPS